MNNINYLKPNFDELWATCEHDSDNYIDSHGVSKSKTAYTKLVCKKILENKAKYEAVEQVTKVPWYLIAGIHFKESSLSFMKMLHNGEPLNIKSRIVPIGVGPFKDWETAAIDSLTREGCYLVKVWTPGKCLEFAESYNGKGYRKKGILSPYVFGFTNHSAEKGGYPTDHVWDSSYPYRRPGVAAIMKVLGVK